MNKELGQTAPDQAVSCCSSSDRETGHGLRLNVRCPEKSSLQAARIAATICSLCSVESVSVRRRHIPTFVMLLIGSARSWSIIRICILKRLHARLANASG